MLVGIDWETLKSKSKFVCDISDPDKQELDWKVFVKIQRAGKKQPSCCVEDDLVFPRANNWIVVTEKNLNTFNYYVKMVNADSESEND